MTTITSLPHSVAAVALFSPLLLLPSHELSMISHVCAQAAADTEESDTEEQQAAPEGGEAKEAEEEGAEEEQESKEPDAVESAKAQRDDLNQRRQSVCEALAVLCCSLLHTFCSFRLIIAA